MPRTRKRKLRKIVVYGVVTPEDWDESGIHSGICVVTDQLEKYGIHLDEIGSELLEYPNESVRVFGFLDTGVTGNKLIKVLDFAPQDFGEEDVWEEGF